LRVGWADEAVEAKIIQEKNHPTGEKKLVDYGLLSSTNIALNVG